MVHSSQLTSKDGVSTTNGMVYSVECKKSVSAKNKSLCMMSHCLVLMVVVVDTTHTGLLAALLSMLCAPYMVQPSQVA